MIDLTSIQELREAGMHEEARWQLFDLASQYPNDPAVNFAAACVHDFLGLEREAVPFYNTAIKNGLTGADLHGAYLGLGSTLRTLGQYADAKQILSEGLQQFPGANGIKVFLAMTLYNLAEYHEAVASLLSVVADTSIDPEVKTYECAIRFYAENLNKRWE